ncbi:hypothetical protein TSAR_013559 [Trichomalopsis sarcophagae]|uniref:Cilia- and flagella-associated protein 157 n=1 Tax=Trichomalopsis sarcophagae TaxID=543379 RepID=A0A232FJ34_9HYME|nr:hypothetical protein TSAR_013559 [Trichomalopsis sarcophagae]
MVDLQEKDKGNISLPARLQSPDVTNIKPKEEDDNHPTIVNVQKAMYEVILKDLQRKIERLQIRNEDLENFCDKVKSSSENVDQESELEIVQLNNNIAIEVKKVNELKKRCDEIEASRENEKLRHLEKIRQMEENFEKTRIQLYSEIKTISAKINMIEEYKLADESLRKKLNDKIETTLRKEDEMEKTLTRLNYKSKIHKENLKKEAYKKILDTSETFQLELKDTTSPTEQRLMRENIVLENELDRLWNDHSNMQAVELNDTIKEYHDKIKEAKSNTKRRLIACKIQNLLIKKLQSVRSKVEKELAKSFQTAEHFEERYLQLLDKTKNAEFSTDNIRKRKLEVMLHQERVKLALTNAFKIQSLSAFKRVSRTLSSLKNAVDSALMITQHDANEELKNMNLQAFGNHLLNIIEDCESERWIAKSESTETVADLLNVYVTGDLGFEPKHIQIIERVSPEMHKSESKSVLRLSALEILKELEQLPTASEKQQQSVSSRKGSNNSGSTDIFNSSATTIHESEVSKNKSADRVEERETISVEEEEDDYEEEDVSDYDVSQLESEIEDFENTVNLG